MSLKVYIFLLFGISIALFFAGYQPLLFNILQCTPTGATCVPTTNFAQGVINSLTTLLANPGFLLGVGLSVIVGMVIGGGFSVYYIIPIIILSVLSNFLILPTDFLLTTGMPWQISMVILGFMNLMLLLTAIEFIRGGD